METPSNRFWIVYHTALLLASIGGVAFNIYQVENWTRTDMGPGIVVCLVVMQSVIGTLSAVVLIKGEPPDLI